MRKLIKELSKNKRDLLDFKKYDNRFVFSSHSPFYRNGEVYNMRFSNIKRINYLLNKVKNIYRKRGQVGNTVGSAYRNAFNNTMYECQIKRPYKREHYVFSKSIASILSDITVTPLFEEK